MLLSSSTYHNEYTLCLNRLVKREEIITQSNVDRILQMFFSVSPITSSAPLARARMSVHSNSMDMLTTMKALLNCGENNFAKLQSKVIDGEADRKMCPSILPVLKRLLFPHSPLQTALPQLLYIIIFPCLSQSTHQVI